MTYEGYIARWIDLSLADGNDKQIRTSMLSVPRNNSDCVCVPTTLHPWNIELDKMHMLPFIDICLIGV